MKKLYLSFMWHMHQPYYKDDYENRYILPWVFLHGIKDYYELPAYHKSFPKMKAVYNLVPSLIQQLEDYATGKANDNLLDLIGKQVSVLSEKEKTELIPQLFMANVRHMIYPSARYRELHDKLKHRTDKTSYSIFEEDELIDLEVLFLISWTGNFIRKESAFITALIGQKSHFTEKQKNELVMVLTNAMKQIIPLYKELQSSGQIELATTPYYHPILPLLIDPESAKEALPDINMPRVFNHFDKDAAWHVKEGLAYFEKLFSFKPSGMWPAEGSVSQAAAQEFADNGVKWIASDEDVLAQSLKQNLHHQNRQALYQPYELNVNGNSIHLFFRDKKLSDLIGFSYSNMDAEAAADDFVKKLKEIYDSCDFNPHVSIILDGENAWEYYYKNAQEFFEALYRKLSSLAWMETVTFKEAIDSKDISKGQLNSLTAGSWIYGNFTTWMGHSEKNKGWELLSEAWDAVKDKEKAIGVENWKELMKELHIAQGSDWFWWFGDDHFSAQSDIFDKLFRTHVINIYKFAGLPIPPELYKPVKQHFKTGLIRPVSEYIHPNIDGTFSGYFEWLGAGAFDLKYDMGSMHTDVSILKTLYWGMDEKNLYLRIDGDLAAIMNQNYRLDVEIVTDKKCNFSIQLENGFEIEEKHSQGVPSSGMMVKVDHIVEISVPITSITKNTNEAVYIQFRLHKGSETIERAPVYSYAELDISDDFLNDWIV